MQHSNEGSLTGHDAHRTTSHSDGSSSGRGQLQHPPGLAANDTAKMAKITAKIARKFILSFFPQLN